MAQGPQGAARPCLGSCVPRSLTVATGRDLTSLNPTSVSNDRHRGGSEG